MKNTIAVTEQEKQESFEQFKSFIMSDKGTEILRNSLDEWFTMREIVEEGQGLEEEGLITFENEDHFIFSCIAMYEKTYELDDEGRKLWTETLKDMFSK
jgi:DNA-binding PadR family transcriptional regulator